MAISYIEGKGSLCKPGSASLLRPFYDIESDQSCLGVPWCRESPLGPRLTSALLSGSSLKYSLGARHRCTHNLKSLHCRHRAPWKMFKPSIPRLRKCPLLARTTAECLCHTRNLRSVTPLKYLSKESFRPPFNDTIPSINPSEVMHPWGPRSWQGLRADGP